MYTAAVTTASPDLDLAELIAAWLAGTVPATREQVVAAAARHYEATAHR